MSRSGSGLGEEVARGNVPDDAQAVGFPGRTVKGLIAPRSAKLLDADKLFG